MSQVNIVYIRENLSIREVFKENVGIFPSCKIRLARLGVVKTLDRYRDSRVDGGIDTWIWAVGCKRWLKEGDLGGEIEKKKEYWEVAGRDVRFGTKVG